MSDILTTAVQDETILDAEAKRDSNVVVVPSFPVPNGSLVNIRGETEILESNPRNLSWDEFLEVNMRVGSVIECTLQAELGSTREYSCLVDVGTKIRSQLVLSKNVTVEELTKRQVLILIADKSATESWILTIGGNALLHPERPVLNGFRLA